MSDFNALLKSSFAEMEEPADAGFSVNVGHGVARVERAAKVRALTQTVGMMAGAAATAWGLYSVAGVFGQDMLVAAGLEVSRWQAALSSGPQMSVAAETAGQGLLQSLGLGMTQILLATGALVGGAVAYRAAQD
ncbi:MAG TPA: hypothetical protein VM915_17580 [Verrucomicrobiae bacterium]|nr:hypothetical protein [Verrucomicrobiae bacterium]